jgi:hypothetical protein
MCSSRLSIQFENRYGCPHPILFNGVLPRTLPFPFHTVEGAFWNFLSRCARHQIAGNENKLPVSIVSVEDCNFGLGNHFAGYPLYQGALKYLGSRKSRRDYLLVAHRVISRPSEFDCSRGIADIDKAAPINLDL